MKMNAVIAVAAVVALLVGGASVTLAPAQGAKVVKIGENDITFSIDEFGFSRQETLLLGTTPTKTAGEAPVRRPL